MVSVKGCEPRKVRPHPGWLGKVTTMDLSHAHSADHQIQLSPPPRESLSVIPQSCLGQKGL